MPESGLNKGLVGIEAFNPNNGEYDQWENWALQLNTSNVTGWSNFNVNKVFRYKKIGSLVMVKIDIGGTSNSTLVSIPLPYKIINPTPGQTWSFYVPAYGQNNGGNFAIGTARFIGGGSVVDFFSSPANAAWTNSGTKRVLVQAFYWTQDE